VVVLDTAGRLQVDQELMDELRRLKAKFEVHESLLVADAMTGQEAVNVGQAFQEAIGLDGIVLTKLDGDARGGAALSVRYVTGAPIMFASTGEKLEDFDVFHPDRMASRILGMGDLLTLIEQAEQAFDAEQAEEAAVKISSGELTLEDFLEQMQAIRRMGPIANLLGMLPGAAAMKEQLAQVDDKQLDRLEAIICGMTPAERADPKIINASRRQRIARGSGVTVSEVNQLVERFFEARKMMQQLAGRFGFPGAGPGRRARKARKGRKGKGRGPTPPKARGALPVGLPDGTPGGMPEFPDLPRLSGLDQLPPGFDPAKLKFRKK
jgi:signal recognition particle subunit SRP54